MESNSTVKKTILVTGSNGQVANEIKSISKNYAHFNFLFTSRETLSITNEDEINSFFDSHKIDFCINCAAYTGVDKAQEEKEPAILANTKAVGFLAKTCKKNNASFIHISTDYVFDGNGNIPYKTDDKTNPVNFYGITKLEGELEATKENENSIIIRTSWVYSNFGNNFVKTMLRLMNERESIGVVNDQFGSPTYAADLAEAIMKIINYNHWQAGIYHYSNSGYISWYDFAKEIALQTNSKCVVNPIPTSQFPTPAKRPGYSVLNIDKIVSAFGIEIMDWKVSLKCCLRKNMNVG